MKKQSKINTRQLTCLGLLTAILLIMAFTPLGYLNLNIGPGLAITLNIIPVALGAVTAGPIGGAVTGAVFGITSFLQCIGIGGVSPMGAVLFGINPFLAFIQRFIPRVLDGFLLGFVFKGVKKISSPYISCAVTGFCAAFFNTALFMSSLVLLYGNTEYVQNLRQGKNIIVFVCGSIGINAVCEMIISTVITGAIGAVIIKARLLPNQQTFAGGKIKRTENTD